MTRWAKRSPSRLITGTTASPLGTASAPPGQKSFCTSTTSKTSVSSGRTIHSSRATARIVIHPPHRRNTGKPPLLAPSGIAAYEARVLREDDMPTWAYRKGVHDLGNGCWAYLQPDGTWGWSNAGLVADQGETLLVDTLFDLKCTRDMLAGFRAAVPAAARIGTLVNTHSNGDHTFGNQLVEGAQIIASRACAEEMKQRPAAELAGMMRNWRSLGPGAAFF